MQSADDKPTADRDPAPTFQRPEASDLLLRETQGALKQEDRIGRYRILQQVGEGGFGVVYLAEQDEPVRRRVALKIIKLGMDTRQVVARFEQERQALAVMDHPNIARVLDAGATDAGRPYFVMEYVPGEPITNYCDRHLLSTTQRLELFLPVCDAVQHAHNKGVIHRDLKPSNVLVTVRDDNRPEPKVIDFGVAKAISHRLTERTIFTEQGQIIGTPEYMSPEQAEMGALDIDTRSDVYSLGVVLYELLTGLLPFDAKDLRSAGYAEIQRIIREVDPPRPSTRLSSAGAAGEANAGRRRSHADGLARDLRRELEWIPLMAMRKDRTQRYRSVTDLADDIRNYLEGRPLRAGPESAVYQMRKFVKRHRGSVTASAIVAASLMAATVVSARFAWSESQARKGEAQQRAVAQTVNGFLIDDLLTAADPEQDGPDVKVVTILDRASETMSSRFASEPDVEAQLQRTLGEAYLRIGDPEQARPHLDRAKALVSHLLRADPDAVAHLDISIGETLWRQNRADEAVALLDPLVQQLKAGRGVDNALTLDAMNQLAAAHKYGGRLDESQAIERDVAAGRQRVLGPTNLDTLIARYNVVLIDILRGGQMLNAGDQGGAEAIWQRAFQDMQVVHADTAAALTPDHWQSIAAASEIAAILNRLNRFNEADTAYQNLLPAMRKGLGDDHWRTLQALANYGRLCQKHEQFRQAATLLEEAVVGYRKMRGPALPDTVAISNWLAGTYESLGRFDDERDLLLRIYADLVAAAAPAERLQPQAARVSEFFQKRGNEEAAREWAARAKP